VDQLFESKYIEIKKSSNTNEDDKKRKIYVNIANNFIAVELLTREQLYILDTSLSWSILTYTTYTYTAVPMHKEITWWEEAFC
jgi:hypothetical protein